MYKRMIYFSFWLLAGTKGTRDGNCIEIMRFDKKRVKNIFLS